MSLPQLLSINEILKAIGVSRATIYRWMAAGTFPSSIDVSEGRVAWYEHEIKEWIESRPRTQGLNKKHEKLMNEVLK
ncbi:TPA: AlpA family phage regulatory protein [Vibrio parahaemolyticus]|uniref:helix-turn-helix transcriptional regulator n=1 Tax=Vibrio parahaemolyticus TaxID=670 RepID=UPI000542A089|nr:AlpA family phage regulatory protein [Vibrio parahaemolyticus]EHH1104548.1 AlpA family phage regulatory protein [Vibrio parahaemolyticus]EHH1933821.1 AlpA family phage regulatory protein [Vibrio parahaemolyticus]EIE1197869.1 AlpA family phage regulatory protein [Vibrio parahaemolyticus]EIZ1042038.1 AlpA family phage regulatory protein [Vibrio parahaemolyticus]EJC6988532.1 AlpA family phage regulatory protein [Vibrio parahaemolyticus]